MDQISHKLNSCGISNNARGLCNNGITTVEKEYVEIDAGITNGFVRLGPLQVTVILF